MKRRIGTGLGILMLVATTGASAQTAPTASTNTFDSLSPGNQKIATALFEAQKTTGTSATATKPLTLDQIAQMKQDGKGWGQVFQSMKSQGLIDAKNLGRVVSQYSHAHHLASGGTITTASGRTESFRGTGSGAAAHDQTGGGVDHGQASASGHGEGGALSHGGGGRGR